MICPEKRVCSRKTCAEEQKKENSFQIFPSLSIKNKKIYKYVLLLLPIINSDGVIKKQEMDYKFDFDAAKFRLNFRTSWYQRRPQRVQHLFLCLFNLLHSKKEVS